MITARALSKRYGAKIAVDDITFTVRPGVVTGFLGPNGAGKSTTMRLILGLDAPTSGEVTVNGKRYAEHRAPPRESAPYWKPAPCTPAGRSAGRPNRRSHSRPRQPTCREPARARARIDARPPP
jgi:ABC-2 type transport system ATP-binding protein